MKILISGGSGFIGSKLLPPLQQAGHQAQSLEVDLFQYSTLERAIQTEKWDTIIHLAGISHIPTCQNDPSLAYRTNLNGTALFLEAVRQHCPEAHFIFASTAQVYQAPQGREITEGVTMDETRAISPQNTYARTKWEAELLLKDASEREGLSITILRLFNHSHRSQAANFFLPHLYSTMTQAQPGTDVTIPVGNLDLYRDIGSIYDLVTAFEKVIERHSQEFEIFNICSGKTKHLGKLADTLASKLNVKAKFVPATDRIRPDEPKSITGSHQKLTAATGWRPQCQSEQELIEEFLK